MKHRIDYNIQYPMKHRIDNSPPFFIKHMINHTNNMKYNGFCNPKDMTP